MKNTNRWGIIGQNATAQKLAAFLFAHGQEVVHNESSEKILTVLDQKMPAVNYIVYAAHKHAAQFWEEIEQWILSVSKCTTMPSVFLISTPFPPGTADQLSNLFQEKKMPMTVINFPAFLLPVEPKDSEPPAGLVFGIPEEERPAVRSFRRVVSHFSPPILFMTRYEAEVLIHFAALYKAEKKHYYDKLMVYCEASGCDAVTIHRGIGLHPKIGQDSGYKKIRPASWVGDQVINYVVPARREGTVPTLCIWNDMENETEKEMVGQLQQWGCRFQQYYPHKQNPKTSQSVLYDNKWEAVNNADAVLILSNSPAFSSIKVKEWQLQKERMKHPLIIDLCNSYEPNELEIAGCQYISPGRTSKNVTKLNKNT
ncbi:hypothetical protein [Aneurinibacillus tyrosinisolvens]|uniref:hypothetical protein n=1 Tax=Aneurinibacillus tyrosinisolvens TaxID=1443435 RepID=UPI00063ED955|nr:hypothetical protein [Aneurinibacillus tyrosinisolvens]